MIVAPETNAVWIVYDGRALSGDTDDAGVLECFGYPDVRTDKQAIRRTKHMWADHEYALYRYDVNGKYAENKRLILEGRLNRGIVDSERVKQRITQMDREAIGDE